MANPGGSSSELISTRPIELSFTLPKAPGTRVYLQITTRTTSVIVFLTTRGDYDSHSLSSLGSFVYALPDRLNPGQSISTPLCINEPTLEFTTRLAKILSRKLHKPVYVGGSASFAYAGGGTVEEEVEGFKRIVQVVMSQINKED
ncbi:hypothetical protein GcM3_190028 [Golovinomyces cichoracearum]|uniref:Proteasome assembly chaperone 3 n=1 Tax=Golovinomyces cichoracearum TaxID=62708 RepID=A0A420HIH9_9PEZI|nr:hypothetical protein GcM3_190028 [Golovinomyces cichoracearum]